MWGRRRGRIQRQCSPSVVVIDSPIHSSTFHVGESITFAGTSSGDDGGLNPDAFIWTSDRDGRIGTGPSFASSTLSEGAHTITLTAVDGNGRSTTHTVKTSVVSDGKYIYAANFLSRNVTVLPTNNLMAIEWIEEPVSDTRVPFNDLAVSPDGIYLYIVTLAMPYILPDDPMVYYDGIGEVTVVRTSDHAILDHILVGDLPTCITVSPDGGHVYVTNANDSTVSVIHTSSRTIVDTIPVGSGPDDIAAAPGGDVIYVANNDDNTIMQIRTSDHTVLSTTKVGDLPWGLAVSPDGEFIYVTNYNDNSVFIIDTSLI